MCLCNEATAAHAARVARQIDDHAVGRDSIGGLSHLANRAIPLDVRPLHQAADAKAVTAWQGHGPQGRVLSIHETCAPQSAQKHALRVSDHERGKRCRGAASKWRSRWMAAGVLTYWAGEAARLLRRPSRPAAGPAAPLVAARRPPHRLSQALDGSAWGEGTWGAP